jgi:uncharacterized cupredoxin-like copper-binding protein
MMLMGPWVVLIVVVVVAVVWASDRRDEGRDDVALRVLDRRLAEGDLTVEEHAQRRQAIQERGPDPRSRTGRQVAIVASVAVVLLLLVWMAMASSGGRGWMAGHMGWRGSTSSTTEVVDGARQIDVEAGELWFDPATVEIVAGEPVNLRLVNTGQAFHDLTIPAADVVLSAEPGEQTAGAVEFSEPGRYEFHCSVPGHAQSGMRGAIVVTDAS